MSLSTPNPIAVLNDEFRRNGPRHGSRNMWVLTQGVKAEGIRFVFQAIHTVRAFDVFNEDNDPFGHHDFGAFQIDGVKMFWKIDYYDLSLEYGSPDPEDPSKTRRVMTIMLVGEY